MPSSSPTDERPPLKGLTADLLGRACRTFLELAYPEGELSAAPNRRRFFAIAPDQSLAELLAAQDVCQKLLTPHGTVRGYALRLGSVKFPHVKLQVTNHENESGCVFAVDTHDALRCAVSADEAAAWALLQVENRRLKERIEQEWEKQGLLTFNALLRQGLEKK